MLGRQVAVPDMIQGRSEILENMAWGAMHLQCVLFYLA